MDGASCSSVEVVREEGTRLWYMKEEWCRCAAPPAAVVGVSSGIPPRGLRSGWKEE